MHNFLSLIGGFVVATVFVPIMFVACGWCLDRLDGTKKIRKHRLAR